MKDPLQAENLLKHVRALAEHIGPRPAGHPAEAVAQEYIRDTLYALGYAQVQAQPFATWDTWGYATIAPALLALAGNGVGAGGKRGRFLGGLLSLLGAYHLLAASRCARQPLAPLYPNKKESKNLLLRIPPTGQRLHRVVLLAHTDTNKHRYTFTPAMKRYLLPLNTLNIAFQLLSGVAQLALAAGAGKWAQWLRRLSAAGVLAALGLLLADELEGYVAGANDNATAVAVLLGLAAHLKHHPLQHTEVWLAFTSAEEVGCVGLHKLLDEHGHTLHNAYFIDFEMVGCKEVAYVSAHSGFSYLSGYRPDPESLHLAEKAARKRPELGVLAREMVIGEEVGALRSRDYRGICLVGVGEDGWLANWHQYSDRLEGVEPEGLERAARFALAMMEELDSQN